MIAQDVPSVESHLGRVGLAWCFVCFLCKEVLDTRGANDVSFSNERNDYNNSKRIKHHQSRKSEMERKIMD